MKALRCDAGEIRLVEGVPVSPREGEASVRVLLAGICNTDLEIVRGYAGFTGILGHEFVGIVEDSPDRSQLGRRVVGEINVGCGACQLCLSGDSRHCARRTVLGIHDRDGAFSEYLSLPPQNLLAVPDRISDRQAVFTEPLAAAGEILEQVEIKSVDRVAIIGDGKLGQLIARVLATTGCSLTVIGKHADKLKLAAGIGINTVELEALKVGRTVSFDVVIEASGAASGLDLALDLVRPRGAVILKSTFHGAGKFDTWRIVVNEIRVVGSRCGRFERALKLLEAGVINLNGLISREFPLADGVKAMTYAESSGILKVLLVP